MDCAKGIGIAANNGRNILEFEGIDPILVPGPPLICVPTTAGTSADISQFDIVNDTGRKVKIAIVSKAAIPDVALIDPVATTTMSAQLTAATGIDALVHAIESYVSLASSPITDLHALEAIRLIAKNLLVAIEEPLNIEHREQMALGSLLAGLAFSNASLGMVHAMAHALGGWMDLPHGECNALLLSHVVQFNFASAPARYRHIGEAFGLPMAGLSDEAAKGTLVAALGTFRRRAGLDRSLRDYGVDKRDLCILAEHAFHDPCLATNPIQPSAAEIEQIYEKALSA
jgi:alcohol dehydrogenase class IV